MSHCLGLDIGGANLKLSNGKALHRSIAFPLWKYPDGLSEPLARLTEGLEEVEKVGITMTGEIADGYPSKEVGVSKIVTQCHSFFKEKFGLSSEQILFYCQEKQWVQKEEIGDGFLSLAAANWHLSASFLSQRLLDSELRSNRSIVFLDWGSTTLDILKLETRRNWRPEFLSDLQRMETGKLVYQGFRRTPLFGLVPEIELDGQKILLAQELFACAEDAYLLCGKIEPNAGETAVADGRPMTIECSRQRIARLLCSDAFEVAPEWIQKIAEQFVENQSSLIERSIRRFLDQEAVGEEVRFLICGEGAEILKSLLNSRFPDGEVLSLSEFFSEEVLSVFPAFAGSQLVAIERVDSESL